MKPVLPTGLDLPENVRVVTLTGPEDQDFIEDITGLVHLDEDGTPLGFEFMFEFDKKDLHVLKHEPYLTVSFFGKGITPFAMQTTVPYDKKYTTLATHTHVCSANKAHDKQVWWQCDNPSHKTDTDRLRTCFDCLQALEDEPQDEPQEELRDTGS